MKPNDVSNTVSTNTADQFTTHLISPNPPQSPNTFLLMITLLTTSHVFHQKSLNLIETVYEKLEKHSSRREMGGVVGGFSYLKRCLQAVPASLFSEKECTLLSVELLFRKKGFKGIFWLLLKSILRLRLPEWKVLLEV